MDLKTLEAIMVENGLIIRAIPKKIRHAFEKEHFEDYPDGEIKYLDEFKREMLVVERTPKNAGKFVIEQAKNTDSIVRFSSNCSFFDSIEQGVNLLIKKDEARVETWCERKQHKCMCNECQENKVKNKERSCNGCIDCGKGADIPCLLV